MGEVRKKGWEGREKACVAVVVSRWYHGVRQVGVSSIVCGRSRRILEVTCGSKVQGGFSHNSGMSVHK